jgi:pimeloyl-ACP methyl ester carboxylesterase
MFRPWARSERYRKRIHRNAQAASYVTWRVPNRSLLTMLVACCALPLVAYAADESFDSNGVKIRYVTEGAGEPVVLLHGWMSDSTMWGRDASGNTKLSPLDGFQLIAMDCRGHGKSDKLYDPAKYGVEMAEDVVRLLDHLKIKKAHLIGYSMGAFIAGKVAASHPERLLSIIYGGQAPLLIGESGSREIDVFARAVDEGKGLGPYIIEVSPPDKKPTLEAANAVANLMYAGKDVKAWAAAGRSFNGLEVRAEDLRKCKVSTLFIYGSKESQSTKTRVASLLKELGGGELKIVEGGDHMTTLAKPEFGTTIVEFLKAHKGRS